MVFVAPAFGQFQASNTSFGQSSSSDGHTSFGTATHIGPSMDTSTFAGGSSHSGSTSSIFGGFLQSAGSTARTTSKGSSVASYRATQEVLGFDDKYPAGKIASISAMPIYTHKSHEELRSEDYELHIKGKANIGFLPEGSQRPTAPMVSGSVTGEPPCGSRIATYAVTHGYEEANNRHYLHGYEEVNNRHLPIILQSISAMPIYRGKSHEELRFEDYEVNAKGVRTPWGNKSIVRSGTPLNMFTNPPISNTFNSKSPFAPFKSNPVVPTSKTFFNKPTTPLIAPSTNPFSTSPNPFAPQSQTFTTTTTPNLAISPNSFSPCINPFTSSQSFVSTNGETSTTPVIAPFINPFSSPTNPFTLQSQTLTISPNPFSSQSNPFAPRSQAFTTPNNLFFRASTPAASSQSNFHNSTTSPTPGPTATFSPLTSVTNIFGPPSQTAFTPTNTTTTTPGHVISPNPFSPQTNLFTPPSQAFVTPTSKTTTTPGNVISPNPFSRQTNPFAPQSQEFVNPNTTTSVSFVPALTTNFNTNSFSPFTQLNPPNNFNNSQVSTASICSTVFPSIWSTSVKTLGPCTPVLNVLQPGQISTTNPSQPLQVLSNLITVEDVGGQNMNRQQPVSSNVGVQPTVVANPFGPRSAVNTSIIEPEAMSSIPRGISSLPVKNLSPPVRMASSFRIRHLSTRRVSLSSQRYNSDSSVSEVPFFSDKEDRPCLVAPLLPRENIRAWVMNKSSGHEHAPIDTYKKGEACEDEAGTNSCFQVNQNSIKVDNTDASLQEEDLPVSGKLHDPLVSSLMPKLPSGGEYYTEPSVKELVAKERAEPGFCSRVKNFVVGRKNKGSIKFLGETDIRHLDLESIVQFNDREVIVYWDDRKKPPVGQGLNRPAEVTLLNVKCVSKASGEQYSGGHMVHRMEKKLMKKTAEQGAEFVSYNPVQGEWKFRVQHF